MSKALVAVNKVELLEGEELMDLAKKVMAAITQNKGKIGKSLGLMGIFNDHIVARDFESGKMFRLSMKRDEQGNVQLEGLEEVKQVFVPVKPRSEKSEGDLDFVTLDNFDVMIEGGQVTEDSIAMIRDHVAELAKAQWTAAFINNLPDSAFLFVAPGGKKDADGKTVPRSLRFFPVKDASGKVDPEHLRNALSRIPQADIPQADKDKCKAAAQKMLEQLQEEGKGKKTKGADEPEYIEVPEVGLWRGLLS